MLFRYRFLLSSALFAACRSSAPGGMPTPESSDPSTAPVDLRTEAASWSISPTRQEHQYTSITSATLESVGSPLTSRDTVISTIRFSLGITRDVVPPSYSARIESISIQGGSKIGQTAAPAAAAVPSLPFLFAGHLEQNRITLELPKTQTETSASCSNEALAAVPVVQRSMILIPLQLRTGMTWTDSTTTAVCSGPLLVSLSSTRTYLVRGQVTVRGSPAVLLEQQNKTSFTGDGVQEQHRIRVRGEGSGRAQITVDAATGSLIDATGDHSTSLTITSSGRDQQFTQRSRERVTRVDN
jgi:hypothetical protein